MKDNISIGDKVVCMTDKYLSLRKFKVYIVLDYFNNKSSEYDNYILINNILNDDTCDYHFYNPSFFVKLKEYRKIKLKKLYSK